jgi:hypothetical protein
MKKKRSAKKQPTAITRPATYRELTEFFTETPFECQYTLTMYEGGFDVQECQSLDITRSEYLRLKVYLAKMRGLAFPTEEPKGYQTSESGCFKSIWSELEPKEIAEVCHDAALAAVVRPTATIC